jgi:hypothetical protein
MLIGWQDIPMFLMESLLQMNDKFLQKPCEALWNLEPRQQIEKLNYDCM